MAIKRAELSRALHELIAALDRRVPRAGEAGAAAIVRDADSLREQARKRLAALADETTPAAIDAPGVVTTRS